MPTTNLDALLFAADLTDTTDRLMLADAMEEAGRTDEASLLRSVRLSAVLRHRRVTHCWYVILTDDCDNLAVYLYAPTLEKAVAEARDEGREWGVGGEGEIRYRVYDCQKSYRRGDGPLASFVVPI